MQKRKCDVRLYSQFLIANHNRYSGVELSRVGPNEKMAHDAVTRFLSRDIFTPSDLWNETKALVTPTDGYLILDDTLLDKRYSRHNELARKQYSGNAHGIVNGICLVNLLWTDGTALVPVDYRIYHPESDDKTKNDHSRDMLDKAAKRGFHPRYVLMDSWYSSVENLKHIRNKAWLFMVNLKSNRKVSVTKGTYIPVADLSLADKQVMQVWLKEYGHVLVTKIVDGNGDITYLATNDLTLFDYDAYAEHWHHRWSVEEFHRAIKQTTGIEACYATRAASQKTHIFAAFKAFVCLETHRLKNCISWYEQKASISRLSTAHFLLSYSNA